MGSPVRLLMRKGSVMTLAPLSHNWSQVKRDRRFLEMKQASDGPRPNGEAMACLLNFGKHLLNCRGLQFLEGLGLDLADALARHGEVLSDLLKRVGFVLPDAEP